MQPAQYYIQARYCSKYTTAAACPYVVLKASRILAYSAVVVKS